MSSNALAQDKQGGFAPAHLMPLLRQHADLKRVRSAGYTGTVSERLFAAAWGRIAAGEATASVMRTMLGDALAATSLGDVDTAVLLQLGLSPMDADIVRQRAIEAAAAPLDSRLYRLLVDQIPPTAAPPAPGFVARLAAQPRAGVTTPGKGRIMFEPPESHADHCAMVAIFGVMLAPSWDADPETVFLASLAHHLHNAILPDSGFAGEMMLGDWLDPVMKRATALALDALAPGPCARVEAARRILPNAATPEGCAFHAADTLDRILQVEHHLRGAQISMDHVLRETELVHAGPVKPFQDAVLRNMGYPA